ncbi:MAG: hypothetical protein EOP11_08330 [Proteobacteria bacterium]|nr:MAG: hypothetical protein EOP11_08330 [Pseudomonadota bacterium]
MRWRFANPRAEVRPKDFEWKVFSREETARIHGLAKAERVSVNAWIMARLNKVILPALLEGPAEGRWLFPVNMRGPVWLGEGQLEGLGNQSSGIPLRVKPDSTAAEIHDQIKRSLEAGLHWATWWMLHVGKLVGVRGMRHFSKSSEAKSFWLGSFTNVGIWDCAEASPDEAWLVAPPGSRNYPIGVGIVTWNGRMSIG